MIVIIVLHGNLKDFPMKVLPSGPNKVLDPSLNYLGTKGRVKFNVICVK